MPIPIPAPLDPAAPFDPAAPLGADLLLRADTLLGADALLHGRDSPRLSLWRSLKLILVYESPRTCELRLGLWTFLFGAIIAWPRNTQLETNVMYAWLYHVPAAFIGWPSIALGLFQVYSVLSQNTRFRLWSARSQTVVALTFAVGCTISAGFDSTAWAFFLVNGAWSVWTLWRLVPPSKDKPSKDKPSKDKPSKDKL